MTECKCSGQKDFFWWHVTHTYFLQHIPLILQPSVHEVEVSASPFGRTGILGVIVQFSEPIQLLS